MESLRKECAAAFIEGDLNQALHLLTSMKEPKRVETGIDFGIFLKWRCRASLLHLSSRNGWLDVVKDLITNYHFDPQETDDSGHTCLHFAALGIRNVNGSLDVMKYLINHHRCNPMATNWNCEPVLHYAVKYIDIVKYLIIECGCDPMTTGYYNMTTLHYAARKGSTDVIKYLINDYNCDPMSVDSAEWTPLHDAVGGNNSDAVEYLLSTGKCDPLARDRYGDTPMKQAAEWHKNLVPIFKKFGKIKSSHPIDSYVNVLLLGNPGAGKSTLSHVITDTATGFVAFGTFRNVKGVEPCTAGIIPTKLQHKTLGNIILHDFAGHSEYYSSHGAVIENLLQGSGGVFLIVVNILEKEGVKQLHQWLTVVRNEAQKALDQCHIIVVASHVDEISIFHRGQMKEKIQEIIGRERCDSVYLDCRKLGGSGMDSFFNKLSSACESIRSRRSGRNLSLYCHMMYGLLEERKENILTLSNVMSAAKDNDSYVLPDEREETLDVLHSLDSIGLISVLKSEEKVWVIVNKGILLSEVNGILFAPETFKEHVDIASNTGIVSVSGLTRLFPDYNPDMLICFLQKMELCQEMNPLFLEMTNLHQLSERGGRGERLLFFPSLLYSDRPDEMTSQVYQFGWCLQCTGEHHFFPSRYFHVLSLHLAYEFALAERKKINRRCTFWRNGIHWFNSHGVGVLVEIVDESQCVLVLMCYQEGCSENMVELRREVIGEVMSVYKESCPSLEVEESVIDPEELDYPVKTPRERTLHAVYTVLSAAVEGGHYHPTNKGPRELKSILTGESLSDINNLSLLGGRDIKVRIYTHISWSNCYYGIGSD